MDIEKGRVVALIEHYRKAKEYPEKSWLKGFCADNSLNYNQWHTLLKSDKGVGIKIIDILVNIFPNVNLNWLLKGEGEMFTDGKMVVSEPASTYLKTPFEKEVIQRLEAVQNELKTLKETYRISEN